MQIEHPVWCGDPAAFHCHATLTGMLGPPLLRNQVIEVGEPRQKRLLAAVGMVKPFHRAQLPLDGVTGLIQPGACGGHLWVREDGIPPRLLVLHPAPHTRAVGRSRCGGDTIDKMA